MDATLAIVVGDVGFLFLISAWPSRLLHRNKERFFLAGRQLPAPTRKSWNAESTEAEAGRQNTLRPQILTERRHHQRGTP